MSNVNEDIGNDLIQAAKKGDINEVRRLISEGANVNAKDNDGWTPLHWAVKNNHSTTAEVLLDNGAGLITFESFQEHYVWRKYQEIETEHCKNSLHLAARLGNLEAVEDLLGKGADVNAQNDIGKTPLHFAAENGYKEVVEALLDKDGIDVNAKDNDGKTPLHFAADNGHKEVVEVLLKGGANVNAKDNSGYTPLHCAANNLYKDVVKALLDKGANVNAEDNDGSTPFDLTTNEEIQTLLQSTAELLKAAKSGNIDDVKNLLGEEGKAQVNATDQYGKTPLHWAAVKGRKNPNCGLESEVTHE